jgi:hypothetical protein
MVHPVDPLCGYHGIEPFLSAQAGVNGIDHPLVVNESVLEEGHFSLDSLQGGPSLHIPLFCPRPDFSTIALAIGNLLWGGCVLCLQLVFDLG